MATAFLSRKPDSGLGNIGASPADPARNIDWVLMTVQILLTVIGCLVVFSASRTRLVADPVQRDLDAWLHCTEAFARVFELT